MGRIQVWYIWYIVRTFANAIMYPNPAQQLKKKWGHQVTYRWGQDISTLEKLPGYFKAGNKGQPRLGTTTKRAPLFSGAPSKIAQDAPLFCLCLSPDDKGLLLPLNLLYFCYFSLFENVCKIAT
jgi:hypothetical protein